MKITKEQVLELVNDLNKLFDDKYLLKDETNGCSIMLKHEPTNITVAYVDNFEKIVVVNGTATFRKTVSKWCEQIQDKEQYVPTNKHFRLSHLPDGVDADETYLKPLMDNIRDLSDAIIKLAKTKNEDPIVQAIKDSHNITVESRGIDSILLETAEKLNSLLDNTYGKRHPKEVTDSLLKIKRSLKD